MSLSHHIKQVSTGLVKCTQKELVVPEPNAKNLVASPQHNKPASTWSTVASAKPISTIPADHICNHPVGLDDNFIKKFIEKTVCEMYEEMDELDHQKFIEQLKKGEIPIKIL